MMSMRSGVCVYNDVHLCLTTPFDVPRYLQSDNNFMLTAQRI